MAFVFILAIYVLWLVLIFPNALPSYTIRDSALFAMVAYDGGIAHAPGSPTWCLLATMFVHYFAFDDPARGTNLFCGLLGILTLVGMALLVWRASERWWPETSAHVCASASMFAPLALSFSGGWWMQCFTTEQYTLMTALLIVQAHVWLSWLAAREAGRSTVALTIAAGVLWALAVGNHLSQVSLIVPIGLIGLGALPDWRRMTREACSGFAGFALGMCVYLWVPLRSRQNPLVDSGNAETLSGVLWLLKREQFEKREALAAPPGFITEWIRSYDLVHQLGIAAAFLIVGLIVIQRRSWRLALVLAALVIPYAAGILWGHLRQGGFGLSYVQTYGVVDWHIAIYMWLALAAAAGFHRLLTALWKPLSIVLGPFILICMMALGAVVALEQSTHYSSDMRVFGKALLEPLPPNAMVVGSTDNVAFVQAYEWRINKTRPDITLAWGSPMLSLRVAENRDAWTQDPRAIKATYYREVIADPIRNPLRVPLPTEDDFTSGTMITDFSRQAAAAAPWMVPHGFLFELRDDRVSNEEALAADARWKAEYLPKIPVPGEYLYQERRAWAELWERRGIYFLARSMFTEAAESFGMSVAWFPEESRHHFRLGECLDRLGQSDVAATLYRQALTLRPQEAGPRPFLAMAEARAGRLTEAFRLVEEELELDPTSAVALRLRDQLKADLGK